VRGGRAGGEFQARHDGSDGAWLRIAACGESALDHGKRHGFRQFRPCRPMAGIRSDRARVFESHEPDRRA
jgi:hypothetical protein